MGLLVIGHGIREIEFIHGIAEASGDIAVKVAGKTIINGGQIGHQVEEGAVVGSGITFIGVAGRLIADELSSFSSAAADDGGELRIYLTDTDDDRVDDAATLNGVAHGDTEAPNNQGEYVFGTGTYSGTSAYYTMPERYDYLIGEEEAANLVEEIESEDVTISSLRNESDFGARFSFNETQFIKIDSELLYDSMNDLTFLATGDVNFNASVQNRNNVS